MSIFESYELTLDHELWLLWGSLSIYVIAGAIALFSAIVWRRLPRVIPCLMSLGFAVQTLAIGYRWVRLDHGPFVTMFEILSSSIWSFTLIWLLVYWQVKTIRLVLVVAQPILFLMMGWLLLAHPGEPNYPATYQTVWLYIHVGFGKVFMAMIYIAVALAIVILLRQLPVVTRFFSQLPDNESLHELAFRFLAVGLVFDSLMLLAGAIWAQDAWGRYWAWDPLETWSFISWLLVAFILHVRVTWQIKPTLGAWLMVGVFIVAFLTFFGVPFVSMAPHKGAI
jgi:ABC-type transport system involved in cytochrome c biogenesis permease subunit